MNWGLVISSLSFLFGSGALVAVYKGIREREKSREDESKAIRAGLQALLRSELLSIYSSCSAEGFADYDEKSNFENLWKNYHNLGANGVMDSIHEKMGALPLKGGEN